MNLGFLFALSVGGMITILSGDVKYIVVASVVYAASVVSDLVATLATAVQKHYQIRNTEVVFNGLAQGGIPEGLRNQVGTATRQAWEQAARNQGTADKDKSN